MIYRVTTEDNKVTDVAGDVMHDPCLAVGDTYTPDNCSWFDDLVLALAQHVPGQKEFASVEVLPDTLHDKPTNFFTDKPFTGTKKKIAELIQERFGHRAIGIKAERSGNSVWYNIYLDRFCNSHHRPAEAAIAQLLKDDPSYVGCDVWAYNR